MVCHDKEEFVSTKEHLLVRYSIHRICLTMLSLIPKCQTKWVYINSEEYMYWWNWGSNPHVYQTSIKLIALFHMIGQEVDFKFLISWLDIIEATIIYSIHTSLLDQIGNSMILILGKIWAWNLGVEFFC